MNKYIIKKRGKTKEIKYDYNMKKVEKETVTENEELQIVDGIIDKKGLKVLTSALKDINDIMVNDPQMLLLKQEELKLKQKRMEEDNW